MTLVTGALRRALHRARAEPSSLVVWVGEDDVCSTVVGGDAPLARIRVSIADATRAARITHAMKAALRALPDGAATRRTVRIRSLAALARMGIESVAGMIAIVPVTSENRRVLVELVEALRTAGAFGVQLVWDGRTPSRGSAERYVFAALERARSTPGEAPVVLARTDEPVEALRILIDHRAARLATRQR